MRAKNIYIFYNPGTHGSFIRWLFEYANDVTHKFRPVQTDLTESDGSAHYVDRYNKHLFGKDLVETINRSVEYEWGYIIYRAIAADGEFTTDEILSEMVEKIFPEDKIIYIDTKTDYLKELAFLNIELKIGFREQLRKDLNWLVPGYNQPAKDLFDAPPWIQRELLSLHFRGMINSLMATPKRYEQILYIDMYDILFGDIVALANTILTHCELPYRKEVEPSLIIKHRDFVNRQKAILYHKNMMDTFNACMNRKDIPIMPMSLFAEAILQGKLRENGIELKCYDLNEMPKTTAELIKLFC